MELEHENKELNRIAVFAQAATLGSLAPRSIFDRDNLHRDAEIDSSRDEFGTYRMNNRCKDYEENFKNGFVLGTPASLGMCATKNLELSMEAAAVWNRLTEGKPEGPWWQIPDEHFAMTDPWFLQAAGEFESHNHRLQYFADAYSDPSSFECANSNDFFPSFTTCTGFGT